MASSSRQEGRGSQVLSALSRFDDEFYLASNDDVEFSSVAPLEHFLRYGAEEGRLPNGKLAALPNARILEASKQIAGAMDTDFYRDQLAQMADLPEHALPLHYLVAGWRDHLDPSPDFSTAHYLLENADVRNGVINPLLHYIRHGSSERRRRAVDVASADVLRRFASGPLARALDEARSLDPMVGYPQARREVTSPFTTSGPILDALQRIRTMLPPDGCRHIVFVANATSVTISRAATEYVRTVANNAGSESVMVFITDSNSLDCASLYPVNVCIRDISRAVTELDRTSRERLLVSLLRGFAPQTVTCIGSDLCEGVFENYGTQLSQEMRLATYLVSNASWSRAGALEQSARSLRYSYAALDKLWCDSEVAAHGLRQRFCTPLDECSTIELLSPPLRAHGRTIDERRKFQDRIRVLCVPEPANSDTARLIEEVASLMPDLQFWVPERPGEMSGPSGAAALHHNIVYIGQDRELSCQAFESLNVVLYLRTSGDLWPDLVNIADSRLPLVVSADCSELWKVVDTESAWRLPSGSSPKTCAQVLRSALDESHLTRKRPESLASLLQPRLSAEVFNNQLVSWLAGAE